MYSIYDIVDTDFVRRLFEKLSIPFFQGIVLYLSTVTTASNLETMTLVKCFSLENIQFPRNVFRHWY